MTATIEELAKEYSDLCSKLSARSALKTWPQNDGSPHVDFLGDLYNYVITERGSEQDRRTTESKDELLYWLVNDVVSDLASKFECQHRIKGQSFRRILFAKKIELMGLVKSEWANRKRKELDQILLRRPYNDDKEG